MNSNAQKIPKIRVLVRKRPLSKKEQLKGEHDIINVENSQTVVVREQKYKVDLTPFIDEYRFNFDGAYDDSATNQQIYHTSIQPLVACAFDGARVSCFAYGQTGSGKTYTMLGDGNQVHGLYLLAAFDIFQQIQNYQKLSVWISFYEIYCGKLYDLLNDRNILYARQDAKSNVNIVGLSERKIVSVENLMQIIEFGTGVRVTAQNGTNVDSSRSHAILQITLKNSQKVHGKISFIDLAGSERAADHADQLEKQTRIDGAEINKSLLALKQCIRALDQNKNHTPFRGSKLTMVLKDSFTGYCRTVMIGNISPNSSSCENTLNTLKYADRVKELKKPNKDHLQMQMMQVDSLSRELMLPRHFVNNRKLGNSGSGGHGNHSDSQSYNNLPLHPHNGQGDNYQEGFPHHHASRSQNPVGKSNPKNNSPQYEPPLFNRQGPRASIPQPNPSPYKQPQQRNYGSFNYQQQSNYQPQQQQPYPTYSQSRMPPGLVQQEQPLGNNNFDEFAEDQHRQHQSQQIQSPQKFEMLAQKHEQYIQLIIEEEEELMKIHQRHINTSIELVKQEMFLMGEADKIGSNIQDYLSNLESVLEKQISSIYEVREKVRKMKADLRQSQRIEKQYIEEAEKYGGDILLDDDDNLFH